MVNDLLIVYPLSQPRRMGFPLRYIFSTSWTPWWSIGPAKYSVFNLKKKKKRKTRIQSESNWEQTSGQWNWL